MSRTLPQIFADFDSGKISRRQLLQALGAAAIAIPAASFAQGGAGGAGGAGTAGGGGGRGGGNAAPAAPIPPAFEPTGWKTVWLDHLNYQCVDHEAAAAFYVALMGWKVRSNDSKQTNLDLGEAMGNIIIRNGLAAPAPAAITDQAGALSKPIQAIFDGFAWGIAPWDTNKVKDELEKRGLKPVAAHDGDVKAFLVKDPDNFNVWVTNGTRESRRKTPANGKLKAPAPFAPTNWKTLHVDHISFEVPDPVKSVGFYTALLGWEAPRGGTDNINILFGEVGGAIIRGNAAFRARGRGGRGRGAGDSATGRAAAPPPPTPKPDPTKSTAAIGHISFGIDNWDRDRVKAELIERKVVYNIKGEMIPRDDFTGTLQSYHVPDAMGWDLQIGNKIKP